MTYSARRDEADAGRIGGACLAFLDRLPRNAAIQAGRAAESLHGGQPCRRMGPLGRVEKFVVEAGREKRI